MVEPLFGSGSSWVATPPPAAAWLQAIAAGSRPMMMTPPLSTVPAVIPNGPGVVGASPQSVVSSTTLPPYTPPVVSGIPPIAPQAFLMSPASALMADMTGITPSGLLSAVAIRRGQPQGPTTEQEVEDFIYDALELLPGTSEVEVRCEGGRATLTGTVSQKRLKRDVGEIAWAIPTLSDVQNNVTITSRRRSRTSNLETAPTSPARKP